MMILTTQQRKRITTFCNDYRSTENNYKKAVVDLKLSHWLADIQADIGTIKHVTSVVTGRPQ